MKEMPSLVYRDSISLPVIIHTMVLASHAPMAMI